MRLVEDED